MLITKNLVFRCNGHDKNSLNTFVIISAAVNSSWAVGAMLGPPITGIIIQLHSFPWATIVLAIIDSAIVSISFFKVLFSLNAHEKKRVHSVCFNILGKISRSVS